MLFNPLVEEITKLIQRAKDWLGNPEDYKLPIQKRRVLIFIAIETLGVSILLMPVGWMQIEFDIFGDMARGQEYPCAIFLLLGLVYIGLAFAIEKYRKPNKDRIKVRAWLAGKGKWCE